MFPIVAAGGILSPNLGLIVWISITFLLLLLLLRRFAWGPITSALTTREEKIASSMDRAEKALAEAREIQAVNEQKRAEAEVESQRLIREARDASEALRIEKRAEAETQARQLIEQAREAIEREKEGALNELRSEVASLAIQAAEKILQENLDTDRQRRLVDNFIDQLPKN